MHTDRRVPSFGALQALPRPARVIWLLASCSRGLHEGAAQRGALLCPAGWGAAARAATLARALLLRHRVPVLRQQRLPRRSGTPQPRATLASWRRSQRSLSLAAGESVTWMESPERHCCLRPALLSSVE